MEVAGQGLDELAGAWVGRSGERRQHPVDEVGLTCLLLGGEVVHAGSVPSYAASSSASMSGAVTGTGLLGGAASRIGPTAVIRSASARPSARSERGASTSPRSRCRPA